MSSHPNPIFVMVNIGPRMKPTALQGADERAICIQAEKLIREAMMAGGGVGWRVNAMDPNVRRRIETYLYGVSDEIRSWPGERKPARIQ